MPTRIEDLLDLGPPVDPAQLLADVPVGGMEDPHARSPPGAGQGAELLRPLATFFFRTCERNTFVTLTTGPRPVPAKVWSFWDS